MQNWKPMLEDCARHSPLTWKERLKDMAIVGLALLICLPFHIWHLAYIYAFFYQIASWFGSLMGL